jgi:hypothetical protein
MKKHLRYLSYVIRHKTFVLLAGLATRAPLWRLIIHDYSKFLPSEWFPYVHSFYGNWKWRDRPETVARAFDIAWNHHQKRNKHHWQYWVLINDSDDPKLRPLRMPEDYIREMVADWMGAGRAITGKWGGVSDWYAKNRDKIILHENTRAKVESLILIYGDSFQS